MWQTSSFVTWHLTATVAPLLVVRRSEYLIEDPHTAIVGGFIEASREPARNAITASNRRWVRTSIVMITYSAIAGSWPNALQM